MTSNLILGIAILCLAICSIISAVQIKNIFETLDITFEILTLQSMRMDMMKKRLSDGKRENTKSSD